ncbi:MAG TPA: ATP-binding protein, partial [Methanocorpusculum sp.]|nr:ATP-binding protein [Methanocorpusculum sp.]
LEKISDFNPWWTGKRPETGIKRHTYLEKILRYMESGEITVLTGIRRSGKTTLLYQAIDHLLDGTAHDAPTSILFVNCDSTFIKDLDNPLETILETYRFEIYPGNRPVLVFDEIQSIDGWEHTIKEWYDQKQYTILLSGSTSSLLDSGFSRLIAGRYIPLQVYPLDFAEFLQFNDIAVPDTEISRLAKRYTYQKKLAEYMQIGGFPAIVSLKDTTLQHELLTGYFHSIIYRDIEGTHEIRNPSVLHDLIEYLVTNISVPFHYEKLAQLFSMDKRTVKNYVAFVKDAFLLYELRFFSYSLQTQERMQKKIYLADTGLRNEIAFSFSRDEGRLMENIVCLALVRSGIKPYFWTGKKEVDFVWKQRDSSLCAINVCYSDEIPERKPQALLEFAEEFKGKVTSLTILTKNTTKTEDGISYIPLWKWLLETGERRS